MPEKLHGTPELSAVKARIHYPRRDQLVVISLLDNPPAVYDGDFVGVPYC